MDVSTFYALFSTTCFTLVGLWWGVTLRDPGWVGDPERRRAIGGVYLAFLLPGLMGLFAQVGGATQPEVWRISFVLVAVVGAAATLRLLASTTQPGLTAIRVGSVVVYVLVVMLGAFPTAAELVGLKPIQVAALLLVLLVALGRALVWHFLVHGASDHTTA